MKTGKQHDGDGDQSTDERIDLVRAPLVVRQYRIQRSERRLAFQRLYLHGFRNQLATYSSERLSVFRFPAADQNTGLNPAKAGQAIAAKWQLKRSDGTVVKDISAVSGISVTSIACANGTPVDLAIPAATSGSSGLRFDETSSQFIFTWKQIRRGLEPAVDYK